MTPERWRQVSELFSHAALEHDASARATARCSPRIRMDSRFGEIPVNVSPTWTAGARLGPYVLLAQIGAGSMGDVWKARDTRLERVVAVKRLKEWASTRFKREARAIAALNHPHIC